MSCESFLSPDARRQTATARDVLGLRGPVRSLSLFQAVLAKKGETWEPQEAVPTRIEQFDRRGNLTEHLSYDPGGTLRERVVFSYDASTNEREVRRYGPENSFPWDELSHPVMTTEPRLSRVHIRPGMC